MFDYGFHDNFPFDIFPLVHFLSRHFPTDTFPSDFFPTDSFPADIFPSDTFPDDFFSSRQFLILTFSQWILSHPTFSHCSNFVDLILRLFLRKMHTSVPDLPSLKCVKYATFSQFIHKKRYFPSNNIDTFPFYR